MGRPDKPPAGSGGRHRQRLSGRGPTPPARLRPGHPAQRRAAAAAKGRGAGDHRHADGAERPAARDGADRRQRADPPEIVAGRNPVVEALRAKTPATALYVATGIEADARVREAVAVAGKAGLVVREVGKPELNQMCRGVVHQGLVLQVAPYSYFQPRALLARAEQLGEPPLLVALDGITDPHNLGAVIRSAAAFGAHGVVVPQRRSAGMTATAWRASAGAAARLPVAQVTNLVRQLVELKSAGLFVVGLDAAGTVAVTDLELAEGPLVLVVGSEGKGLSRLVGETCDLTARIPMATTSESLNASVAAAVALAEVASRRRTSS